MPLQKEYPHDSFGSMAFPVKNIIETIPRSHISNYKHINLESLILNKSDNKYTVHPNRNTKYFSKDEADIAIRKYIWDTFFKEDTPCNYSESMHYPTMFKVYMETKLGLNLQDYDTLNNFIVLVRNALFTRIIFLFKPYFIQAVNTLINNSPIRIHNEPVYEIKQKWKYWVL